MRIELQYDVQVVAHFGLACAKWRAGRRGFRRGVGFWCFLDSNVLCRCLRLDRAAAIPGGDEHPRGEEDRSSGPVGSLVVILRNFPDQSSKVSIAS
jgi:hypothetical protein